jgi:hypothetical protein
MIDNSKISNMLFENDLSAIDFTHPVIISTEKVCEIYDTIKFFCEEALKDIPEESILSILLENILTVANSQGWDILVNTDLEGLSFEGCLYGMKNSSRVLSVSNALNALLFIEQTNVFTENAFIDLTIFVIFFKRIFN